METHQQITGAVGGRVEILRDRAGIPHVYASVTPDLFFGLGVAMVQFIGGEPTLHPRFAELLSCAIDAGLGVEVYSNLTRVKESWWELFACPNVSLATSYYSDLPGEHDAITGRPGSHARTLAGIREAVARRVPLRAGVIGVREGQRIDQAAAELAALGVADIRVDRLRRLGRAAGAGGPDAAELCGRCGRGIAAVLPSGEVCPCVMSRWLTAGNVRESPLADILSGPAMAAAVAAIPSARSGPDCAPDHCNPDLDGNDCRPAESALSFRNVMAAGGGCAPGQDGQCGPSKPPLAAGAGAVR